MNVMNMVWAGRKASIILLVCLVIFLQKEATGAIIASISSDSLANNSAGQTLQVFLTSDEAIPDIGAINLYAEIGDGTSGQTSTPRFTSFSWNPAIVSSLDSPGFFGATPEAGNNFTANPQIFDFATPEEGFDLGTSTTLLGTFTIDTTGVFDQAFNFFIGDSPGATSDVNNSSGSTSFALAGPTTFQVGATAVPEPASCLLGGLAMAGFVVRRRWGRSTGLQQAA